ncbi:MAG: peptidoglycan DD-metalloendopeptidase family protein, partial [Candidatus Liptonbacteria bacterium]|nr:peptidoglycan DD-metalloendopeptidase family protein [Candidatus Liptonbacteria bacterium]
GQIAKQFGVSLNTLLGANPGIKAASLKIGQEIYILPVSGIIYRVKDGETAEAIAATYGLTVGRIKEFNPSINLSEIGLGTSLILPGVTVAFAAEDNSSLPDLRGYFLMPANGYDWGKLHNNNAVDIANACGTEVKSSAEGLVVDFGSPIYFNGGYGGYALVEHPNGTKTRYAHLAEVTAQLGTYIEQGQKIGKMGSTGNVHGPTGCHLHFEVYGARNPFAKI